MNKNEYIGELKRRLSHLPAEELDGVVMYYEEYFSDAADEQQAIAELGTPAHVASQLIGEFVMKADQKASAEPNTQKPPKAKSKLSVLWIALLAVFASPIALPIAIVFFTVILVLIITVFAVLLVFGVTGFTLILGGFGALIVGLTQVIADFASAMVICGASLVLIGVGIAFAMFTAWITRLSIKGLSRLVGKVLVKRNKTGGMTNETVQ